MVDEPWSLDTYIKTRIALVEASLDHFLPHAQTLPVNLHDAMRYSVFAGGKRIRPVLMAAACEAVGGETEAVMPAAAALEMIHSYSLIHDDLPAMDNDDLRRGKPTNHKVYGEAIAILAGDGLLTEAFILLTNPHLLEQISATDRLELVHLLAKGAGSLGMVGGQVVDMASEGEQIDLPTLEYIHTHKTGALILAAVEMGAIIGGADKSQRQALHRYGEAAGLAFQVADDILDIVADQSLLGKEVGSDAERGKATYPALLGLEGARQRARDLRDMAFAALEPLGETARPLREIATYIIDRSF